jgi:hypothetical protein
MRKITKNNNGRPSYFWVQVGRMFFDMPFEEVILRSKIANVYADLYSVSDQQVAKELFERGQWERLNHPVFVGGDYTHIPQ